MVQMACLLAEFLFAKLPAGWISRASGTLIVD